MARRRPTNAQLIANSRHLLYEIQMFGHTRRLLGDFAWDDGHSMDDKIRTLALIESHLTHARSLMRFLYPPPGAWATDMCANDYLRKPSAVAEKWSEFDSDLAGIDKEIAHLTYLRPPKPTNGTSTTS